MPAKPLPRPPTTGSGTTIVISGQRKQNIACDQCRQKKVRCLRASKNEICQQCSTKDAECTSNYIDSLELAREGKQKIRKLSNSAAGSAPASARDPDDGAHVKKRKQKKTGQSPEQKCENLTLVLGDDDTRVWAGGSANGLSTYDIGESSLMACHRPALQPLHNSQTSLDSIAYTPRDNPVFSGFQNNHTPSADKQLNLLRYLFSPYPVLTSQFGYTDVSSIAGCEAGTGSLWEEEGGKIWTDEPSETHLSLDEVGMKDLAEELLENYLSIVNLRTPIHSPAEVRARFLAPDTHEYGPLPHPLLSVMLAWGARFSDASIVLENIKERSGRDQASVRESRGSRIAHLLVARAREVVESSRIYRSASVENAQALTLLEGVLSQAISSVERDDGFYSACAIKHMRQLLDRPVKFLAPENSKERNEVSLLWRTLAIADGVQAIAFGSRPGLDVEEHGDSNDSEQVDTLAAIISAWSVDQGIQRSVTITADWLKSQRQYAGLCHKFYLQLFHPRVKRTGISRSSLADMIEDASKWREQFLPQLGVPTIWPDEWDFSAAITACATDVLYHYLWLVLDRALKEVDIVEEKSCSPMTPSSAEIGELRKRVERESEHAALRIAALVAVLTENAYLRLDPTVLYHPIYEAGLYLATRGREECQACMAGLEQYSQTFPAAWIRAEEIQSAFAVANGAAGSIDMTRTFTSTTMTTTTESSTTFAPTPTTMNASLATVSSLAEFDATTPFSMTDFACPNGEWSIDNIGM